MNHDDHDGHDSRSSRSFRMRLPSPLAPEAEHVMSETIECAFRVHRELRPGFLESIYRKAMYFEMDRAGLAFQSEQQVSVKYREILIPGQRVDLIVENLIVVELKAVARFDDIHRAQLISYLRTTGLRGGLLINFHAPVLHAGLKRIVL
jgi:GxxExxY protein